MVVFVLEVKARLEGVASLQAKEDNEWSFTLRNPLNDYETRENVTVSVSDEAELENDKAKPVNLALKWDGANKASTLSIMATNDKVLKGKKKGPSYEPRAITESDTWTPILALDCRGIEPSAWNKGVDEFTVTSSAGTVFDSEVDLSDEDGFSDYCETGEIPVEVADVEYRFTAL